MIRFRGNVECLRAVAVLPVILNHLVVAGFGGGFVGVDVFSVISSHVKPTALANGDRSTQNQTTLLRRGRTVSVVNNAN